MTDIPDGTTDHTTPATVEQVVALVGHDDERFDDLLLVLAGDSDYVTTQQGRSIAAIIATFTAAQITELCEAYDLCPRHRGDIQICIEDDVPECREYRHGRRSDPPVPSTPVATDDRDRPRRPGGAR